uniref:Uncharacterized protein n=1 Tax=Rhizophora mucronata TaxID=61149 RepID=A0A2P2J977_RHIMU
MHPVSYSFVQILGFFHRRHVRKSAGSFTADCMYSCHHCRDGKYVNIDTKKVKVGTKSGKNKKSVRVSQHAPTGAWSLRSRNNRKVTIVVPLRRSTRKTKYNSTLHKKVGGCKKGKKVKSRKAAASKPQKISSWRKKRTQAYHSYWLNGLLLSRKPDDEQIMHFRQKRLLVPFERVVDDQQPRCHLCCEADYTVTSNYISCEICGEWFHGDAFGLNGENIGKLIGFRCHVCRKSAIPICSHVLSMRGHGQQKTEAQNVEIECSEGVSNSVQHQSEMNQLQHSCSDEDHLCALPVDGLISREKQFGAALDSNHSSVLKPAFEGQNGNSLYIGDDNADEMQISNQKLAPVSPTSAINENVLEGLTTHLGYDAFVTPHAEVQSSCQEAGVGVMEPSLGHDFSEDSLAAPTV